MLVSTIILIILILVSGVISSSEIALSSSNRNKVKIDADKGDKKAKRLLDTIDNPHNFFATTQLYITFIAFFLGAYTASVFSEPLLNLIYRIGLPISEHVAELLVFFFITLVLTYAALVIGELVPKRIAMQYAIPFAYKTLPFLKILFVLALPLVKILAASAKIVLKLLRIKDAGAVYATKEEIRLLVESSSEHGHIAEAEQGMIENIFNIEKLTAGDICTHRLNVVGLPIDTDFKTIEEMLLTGDFFTRIPIYEETIDNIRGILYTKDLLRYIAATPDISNFDIKTLMRDAHFVPDSKKSDELFQEMRKKGIYIAVVVDEHGGTLGIVTMEDLVEIIVGSIQDEYDGVEQPDILPISENVFRIQGTADLEDVQNHFERDFPVDDYNTLSGFLVAIMGRIPLEDEQPEVAYNGLLFKVESVVEKRIGSVTVTKQEKEGGEA